MNTSTSRFEGSCSEKTDAEPDGSASVRVYWPLFSAPPFQALFGGRCRRRGGCGRIGDSGRFFTSGAMSVNVASSKYASDPVEVSKTTRYPPAAEILSMAFLAFSMIGARSSFCFF